MPAIEAGGSTIVVERAERALVIRSADADEGAVGFAAELPAEPARATVVVDASAAGALQALDDRLVESLRSRLYADFPPGSEMRLVAAKAGRTDPSGAPPLAARLADRLGVGVVAPDGELIALRGGELFSAGPGAGWLGFRRSGEPEWTGPRYPAPAWQSALPRALRTTKPRPLSRLRDRRESTGRVTVTAIPAGIWVRGAENAPFPLTDLGFGVPVEPSRPIVLVGAPGEPLPGVGDLTAFFRTLPADLRETTVLVPYGHPPETCVALAQGLADRLGVAIRGYHALPHYAMDGTRRFAVFNANGTPERLTRAPENLYVPAPTKPGTPRIRPASLRLPIIDETDPADAERRTDLRTDTPGTPAGGNATSGTSAGPPTGGSPRDERSAGGTATGALTLADTNDSKSFDFEPVSLESVGFEPIGSENLMGEPAQTTPQSTIPSPNPPPSPNAMITVDARGVLRPTGSSAWQTAAAPRGMSPALPVLPAASPPTPSGPARKGGALPASSAPGSDGAVAPA
ncbi:MAG: hypothetical protein ACRDP6_43865, partial [Actinoallomurus sp.]